MKTTFFLLFVFSLTVYSQIESTGGKNPHKGQPGFFQDLLNFATADTAVTRVDMFVQVAYPEIKFIKSDGGFAAGYTVTVSVFDEKKDKLITEKNWSEKMETIDFTQTTTRNNYSLSLKSFNLAPGVYFFRVAVEDKESKRVFLNENLFTVKNFNKKVSLSDFIIIAKQTSGEGNNRIIPNVSRNVATQKNGLQLFFEINSDSVNEVTLEYVITNKAKQVALTTTEVKNLVKGKNQIFTTIKAPQLPLGEYAVSVTVKNKENQILDIGAKGFISKWIGVPSNINDLEKAVNQMMYIATDKELSYIKDTKEDQEKVKRFMEFWKKKDPSPSTEENEVFDEYYARIAYANENFSHYGEGWRSDMGMVYILLGPPSNVDRHPFDYNSKPYEIWQYYDLNKEFIFLDSTGFGDYRLITPLYGDNYRFRN